MTRDEVRALAERVGDTCDDVAGVCQSCVEDAIVEACERVLEEAARRIEDRRERYAEHGYGASSAGPMMNDDDVETVRALAAALKGEPNDG